MRRRGLAITLAVLLAILGTAGVLAYVNHANARALAGQKAVTVLIAKQLIPAGTAAGDAQDNGLLGTERLPAASVPANAVTAVNPDIRSLVTDSDLQPGQLLLRPMLVASTQATGGIAIPSGKIAVAILFCLPEAVAGNVRPGSEIAVFDTVVTVNPGTTTSQPMSAQTACSGPHQSVPGVTVSTRLVLPKVTVLTVGPAASGGQGGSQPGSASTGGSQGTELVTVAVSQRDAARLIELTQNGLPYLALVNASSDLSISTTGVSASGN